VRFTQPDPIGIADGLNAYGFAGGDPVNFADPFGLCIFGKDCLKWFFAGHSETPPGGKILRAAAMIAGAPGNGCAVRGLGGAAATSEMGTRYMGHGEAAVVEKAGTIPNTDAINEARVIHYTTDAPTMSAADAIATYKRPNTATHMCRCPLCSVRDNVPPTGTVLPGASQAATSQPIVGASTPIPLKPSTP
jgi:hypothetical protein